MKPALPIVALMTLMAAAQQAAAADYTGCPDAGLLSAKLLTDICWDCIFPIRIAGTSIGSGVTRCGAFRKSRSRSRNDSRTSPNS